MAPLTCQDTKLRKVRFQLQSKLRQSTSKGNEFSARVSVTEISCLDIRKTLRKSWQMHCNEDWFLLFPVREEMIFGSYVYPFWSFYCKIDELLTIVPFCLFEIFTFLNLELGAACAVPGLLNLVFCSEHFGPFYLSSFHFYNQFIIYIMVFLHPLKTFSFLHQRSLCHPFLSSF